MTRCVTALCCAALLLTTAASAATHTVRPDGTGDFPTIQAAVNAADMSGDIIELADGVFTGDGNRDVDFLGKAVTIRSAGGDPALCVIDCEGSPGEPHRGFVLMTDEGPDAVLEGITIMHGWAEYYGGGVICGDYASPTITDCVFYKNESAYGGALRGGLASLISGCDFIENTSVRGGAIGRAPNGTIRWCDFIGNQATYGGAIYIRSSCSPTMLGCMFEGNTASHSGGAVHIEQHSDPQVLGCTFTGNSAPIGGAIDISIECAPRFENCTIADNSCSGTGVVAVYELCTPTFLNTIIAFSETAPAVTAYDGGVKLLCCDIYGNDGGDWAGTIAGQLGIDGNISADPLFCREEYPDEPYTLHWFSPCSPYTNPGCGFIGAWDLRCGFVPVERTTWGALKALYR